MPAPASVSGRYACPVAQPQPRDDGGGRGVLDQQRRADVRPPRRPRRTRTACRPPAPRRRAGRCARCAGEPDPSGRAAPAPRAGRRRARRRRGAASTTAPGLQPASISPRAREPDNPNETAETSARSSPPARPSLRPGSLAIVVVENGDGDGQRRSAPTNSHACRCAPTTAAGSLVIDLFTATRCTALLHHDVREPQRRRGVPPQQAERGTLRPSGSRSASA